MDNLVYIEDEDKNIKEKFFEIPLGRASTEQCKEDLKNLNEPPNFLSVQNEKVDEKTKKLPQVIAALGANMGAFAVGTVICWSATAMPSLKKDENFEEINVTSSSWISSIMTLGALSACLPAGFLVDRLGRRMTMLLTSIPFVGGWVFLHYAQNTAMILVGRFITGVCTGIFTVTIPVFMAETSEPCIRGMLTSAYDSMVCAGILVQLIIGAYFKWREQSLICIVPPTISFIILYFVPESPRFLLSKGKNIQASKSLCWLRGVSENSKVLMTEMEELHRSIEEDRKSDGKGLWLEFLQPHVRKGMMIGFILFFLQSSTGMMAVMFYRVEIFESAHVHLDEYTSSMIVGVVDMLVSTSSAAVVDRFGRKILLIISEILLALSLAGLGAFFHVQKIDMEFARDHLGFLPLTSLIIYVGGFSVGMGAIPFSVAAEILPQRVRGIGGSILTASRWAMSFLVTRFFKDLMMTLGEDGGYWSFSVVCVIGVFYIYFFLPETKGKTLEEIQLKLKK